MGRSRYLSEELVPVVVAAALWGWLRQGHHICFHSVNKEHEDVQTTTAYALTEMLLFLLYILCMYLGQ